MSAALFLLKKKKGYLRGHTGACERLDRGQRAGHDHGVARKEHLHPGGQVVPHVVHEAHARGEDITVVAAASGYFVLIPVIGFFSLRCVLLRIISLLLVCTAVRWSPMVDFPTPRPCIHHG